MARPTNLYGNAASYLPSGTAQSIFDTDPASLPPLTRALRNAWGAGGGSAPHPIPTAEAMAAMLVAVHDLEQRVIALEGP